MTPPEAIDLAALRRAAQKADAVDVSQPDREFTIYYDYPGCAKDQECRVATAWCREWAEWIAATTPRKVLALLDRLAAADVVVDVARICDWTDPEDERAVMGRALAAYDRAIAGQQQQGTT